MKLKDFLTLPTDSRERVEIFIDGSNLYHSMREECGKEKLDFFKFARLLSNGRKTIRSYVYVSMVDAQITGSAIASSQLAFVNKIREIPYLTVTTTKLKYKKVKNGGKFQFVPYEKGVDIRIATDMLTGALRNCYDTAILVSGDGDFAPVLEEIKRAGKQLENATFKSVRSDALVNASDLYIELSKHELKHCFVKRHK